MLFSCVFSSSAAVFREMSQDYQSYTIGIETILKYQKIFPVSRKTSLKVLIVKKIKTLLLTDKKNEKPLKKKFLRISKGQKNKC